MVNATDLLKEIYYGEKYDSITSLLDGLNSVLKLNIQHTDKITSDLADSEFLNEVRTLTDQGIPIYFGKTLRDLKCVITDDALRDHVIYLQYNGLRKLVITSTTMPNSSLQDQEHSSIIEVVTLFKNHIENLKGYFHVLESIDRYCTVVDPQKPTFKEDYRRILLGKPIVQLSACWALYNQISCSYSAIKSPVCHWQYILLFKVCSKFNNFCIAI